MTNRVKFRAFNGGHLVEGVITETKTDHKGRIYYNILGDDGVKYSRYTSDFIMHIHPAGAIDSGWEDHESDVHRIGGQS